MQGTGNALSCNFLDEAACMPHAACASFDANRAGTVHRTACGTFTVAAGCVLPSRSTPNPHLSSTDPERQV